MVVLLADVLPAVDLESRPLSATGIGEAEDLSDSRRRRLLLLLQNLLLLCLLQLCLLLSVEEVLHQELLTRVRCGKTTAKKISPELFW